MSEHGAIVAYLVYRGRDGEVFCPGCYRAASDSLAGCETEELSAAEYAEVRRYEVEENDADPAELACRKCGRSEF